MVKPLVSRWLTPPCGEVGSVVWGRALVAVAVVERWPFREVKIRLNV